MRILKIDDRARFYQASTSELFGEVQEVPQRETTPFNPQSPYATSKLFAYWTVINYRKAYRFYAANGILFNHESPIRGEGFVSQKIVKSVVAICMGRQKKLKIGNLEAKRDWGHAKDYVKAMWHILQHPYPDDWVIATGKTSSVRTFLLFAFEEVGLSLEFQGTGKSEVARIPAIDREKFYQKIGIQPSHIERGDLVVQVDEQFYRPAEVNLLIGDPTKAKNAFLWEPTYTVEQLICEMIDAEIQLNPQSLRT